jgi:hypothetical protein
MIRYTDKNPPRYMGEYINSYRTRCGGVVVHLFRAAPTNIALIVRVDRSMDHLAIVTDVLSVQHGKWRYEIA